MPENIQNILNNKGAEATDRKRRVKNLLEDAIKEATFFINGSNVSIKGSTVKEKMNNGFRLLVDNVYTKMGYMNEHLANERDLVQILVTDEQQMSMDDKLKTDPNALAVNEIRQFVTLQDSVKKQMTVKTFTDRFTDKPFGWRELDIQGVIARLLKEQSIQIRYDAVYLDPVADIQKMVTALTKPAEAAKTIVVKRIVTDPKLLRIAVDITKDVFNKTALPDDEDGLKEEIEKLIAAQVHDVGKYQIHYENKKYPGMSLLNKGIEYFSQFTNGMDNHSFFTKLKELEDDLYYWTQDVTAVKGFFDTNQRKIFDDGLEGLRKYEDNKTYLYYPEVELAMMSLREIIEEPIPYKMIKDIPEKLNVLTKKMEEVLQSKIEDATKKIKIDFETAASLAGQDDVSTETKQLVMNRYEELLASIPSLNDIYRIDATITQSADFKNRMERVIQQEIMEAQRKRQKPEGTGETVGPTLPTPRAKQAVKLTSLVAEDTLETEQEVDQYILLLSDKLKQIIREDKTIKLIQ